MYTNYKLIKTEEIEKLKREKKGRESGAKVRIYDFFSQNEMKMANILKQIPDYELYINPIQKYSEILLVDEENGIMKKNNRYFLFEYWKQEKERKYSENLISLFFQYKQIESSIEFLSKHGIVYLNIDLSKVGLLSNFEYAFSVNEKLPQFNKYIPEKNWPIQLQIICYLNEYDLPTLSKNDIQLIIKNTSNLGLYSCLSFLKWVNKPKKEIIEEMMKSCLLWDQYSLCMEYLLILNKIVIKDEIVKIWINDLLFRLS
jgi:hypothetical protein